MQLEPSLRRALQPLRRLYAGRGSWEAVLQIADSTGRTLSVVVEPVMPRPRVIDGPVDPNQVASP